MRTLAVTSLAVAITFGPSWLMADSDLSRLTNTLRDVADSLSDLSETAVRVLPNQTNQGTAGSSSQSSQNTTRSGTTWCPFCGRTYKGIPCEKLIPHRGYGACHGGMDPAMAAACCR